MVLFGQTVGDDATFVTPSRLGSVSCIGQLSSLWMSTILLLPAWIRATTPLRLLRGARCAFLRIASSRSSRLVTHSFKTCGRNVELGSGLVATVPGAGTIVSPRAVATRTRLLTTSMMPNKLSGSELQ